jgi:glycosyltransferase involved in cell wall biosynthesis
MNSAPRVSLIVPAFNEPPVVLRESMASVRAQTFADFECIVVDESTDPARAHACRDLCAADARFVYLHPERRLGLPGSLNLALERARGALIARFDSDDVCVPERLALQVAFMDAQPQVTVLGGGLEVIDDDGRTLAFRHYPEMHAAIARGMHLTTTLAHPTVMFRREATSVHGVYDPTFRFSEDLDLWLRWQNAGLQFANLSQVLVKYRQKSTSRQARHWRFNLRARVKNFARRYALRRALGIVAISTWILLPTGVQEVAFRALLLRRIVKRPAV